MGCCSLNNVSRTKLTQNNNNKNVCTVCGPGSQADKYKVEISYYQLFASP